MSTHASQHAWEKHRRAIDGSRLSPPEFTWQETVEPQKYMAKERT